MPAPVTRRLEAFQPRLIPGAPYRPRRTTAASPSHFGHGSSSSTGTSGSILHRLLPSRLNGAINGHEHPEPRIAATRRIIRRGQLRREPVWIDGVDPQLLNPASELRGADPRALPENRYWNEAWGPLPTLADLDGPSSATPSVTRVLEWLQGRYDAGSEPYFQALNHIFPLPGSSETLYELRPHFERILETSLWRAQSDDWQGGIEPVERVREPARADDAADSEADVESIGYISDQDQDQDYLNASEEASSSDLAQLGPSSAALESSLAPPALLPAPPTSSESSHNAGPSAAGSSRQRKRTRDSDSDAERSTTSSSDEERPATRRRLNPRPSAPASSPSTARRRGARSWLPPNNAVSSTPLPLPRPRRTVARRTAPSPSSVDLPATVQMQPSECPREANDAAVQPSVSSQAVACPSFSVAEPSSSVPPRTSPRRSRRLARGQTAPAPMLTSTTMPESSAAPSVSSNGVPQSQPGAAPSAGPSDPEAVHRRVLRPRKRTRDDEEPGAEEDANAAKRKRPRKK
ncbi:hypothetical protein C8Q73DRAFT_715409 [Cubamyces lactineus]|nr:hypothetical protein C8Q73DRAFT_715409 [Cubamyces lactineus]